MLKDELPRGHLCLHFPLRQAVSLPLSSLSLTPTHWSPGTWLGWCGRYRRRRRRRRWKSALGISLNPCSLLPATAAADSLFLLKRDADVREEKRGSNISQPDMTTSCWPSKEKKKNHPSRQKQRQGCLPCVPGWKAGGSPSELGGSRAGAHFQRASFVQLAGPGGAGD